jgi:hypothetical protein
MSVVSALGPKEDQKLRFCDLLLPGGRQSYKSEMELFTALGGKDAEGRQKDGMIFLMIVNMLGAEGWELIADEIHETPSSGMTSFHHTISFKRQVR